MNETDRRRAEVYAAIPRIREIDEEIASSSLSLARKRILSKSSSDSDKDDVHRHNKELLAEKKVLLKIRLLQRTILILYMNVNCVVIQAMLTTIHVPV